MNNKSWRSSPTSNYDNKDNENHQQQAIYLLKSFSEHTYHRFDPRDQPVQQRAKESSKATTRSTSFSSLGSSKMQGIFRMLKRKFRKEKKLYSSNHVIVPYNSYTYAKNFDDQDLALADPDNLCRSFSSRFAASSSGVFERIQSVR